MQASLLARNDSDAAQTDTSRTVAQKRVLADNRPEAMAQRKLAEMMNNSPRVLQQRALSDAIHNSPRMAAQRHEVSALFGGAVKPKRDGAMPAEASPAPREEKINKTGLPNQLQSGIESLSGMSMDHVTVHYNSDKPAQLQAHAYAQGSEIYLGAGQERHLPHEAWHVVQQAQGRVRPTLQIRDAVSINDDEALEQEADVMGERAAAFGGVTHAVPVAQSAMIPSGPVQRVSTVGAPARTPHALVGAAIMSDKAPVATAANGDRGVIIEVMEGVRASAIAKIDSIAASATATDNRAIMIGLNRRAADSDVAALPNTNFLKPSASLASYAALVADATVVATHAEARGVQGGCFPTVFSNTAPGAGYTFPFLEMRANVTLHPGTAYLISRLRDATAISPVMRSMDADVTADSLLATPVSAMGLDARKAIADLGRVPYEEREVQGPNGPENSAPDMTSKGADIVSGGYLWDTAPQDAAFWGDGFAEHGVAWNRKLTLCLETINAGEHQVRQRYNAIAPKAVYWPEPNTYMDSAARTAGASVALERGKNSGSDSQQRESSYYVREIGSMAGRYMPELQTTKPLKGYFTALCDLIKQSFVGRVTHGEVDTVVRSVRQTHLSESHLGDIGGWNNGAQSVIDSTDALNAIRRNVLGAVVRSIVGDLR